MKAILEIEMPENCLECGLSYKKIIHNVGTFYECQALGEEVDCAGKEKTQRHRDCPLKIIDEAKNSTLTPMGE